MTCRARSTMAFGRGIELLHDVLHLGAGQGRDGDAHLVGIGQELRILHGGIEGGAQGGDLLGRRAGRRDIGALENLLAHHHLGHFAIFVVVDVFPQLRHAHLGQFRIGLEPDLHQDVELVVAQPVRLLRLGARPVPAAHAVDLAALHGERDVGGALVAGHDVELGAGGVIVQIAVVAGRAAGRGRAQDGLLPAGVIEGLDLGGLVGAADARAGIGGADIDHLGGIELRVRLVVEQRPDDGARHQRSERRAVLGRHIADEDRRAAAAGARHVLDHDGGIARNMPAQIAGDRAGIDVIAAAHVRPDLEIDGLAGIEIGCRGRWHECQTKHEGCARRGRRSAAPSPISRSHRRLPRQRPLDREEDITPPPACATC